MGSSCKCSGASMFWNLVDIIGQQGGKGFAVLFCRVYGAFLNPKASLVRHSNVRLT